MSSPQPLCVFFLTIHTATSNPYNSESWNLAYDVNPNITNLSLEEKNSQQQKLSLVTRYPGWRGGNTSPPGG